MAAQHSTTAGTSLGLRVRRGTLVTVMGFGLSNVIRLGSNLILARLLFPEAFGLMALVTVLLVGLSMFSDLGLAPSIQSSPRGDEPDFLNTAFSIQIVRAVLLFILACALAWPMARFYDEPQLLQLIPAAALAFLITAVQPTRSETVQRHLALGRLTMVDLASQVVGVGAMLVLAWATGSVWALILGNLASAIARVVLAWTLLPGIVNRPQWERDAARELIRYGKWIFLSTVAGFLVLQSDKLVLGRFLTMEALGLYNIGYFLASFPMLLGQALIGRMMIPIYRENPPAASAANYARLRRLRFALSAFLLALLVPLVLAGFWLVDVLYDPRYAHSGAVVVMLGLAMFPQVLVLTYDQAALASGDSRGFFVLSATRAALTVLLLLTLVPPLGVMGAALALGLSSVLAYPMVVWLARRHGAWDGFHDAAMGALALVIGALALWSHAPALAIAP